MLDTVMPVQIYRGKNVIGTGQLFANGAGLVLTPDDYKMRLLNFAADTTIVEDKIPMTFFCDDEQVSAGELYNSGDYICLCPLNQDVDLLNSKGTAVLFVEPTGLNARLDVSTH